MGETPIPPGPKPGGVQPFDSALGSESAERAPPLHLSSVCRSLRDEHATYPAFVLCFLRLFAANNQEVVLTAGTNQRNCVIATSSFKRASMTLRPAPDRRSVLKDSTVRLAQAVA